MDNRQMPPLPTMAPSEKSEDVLVSDGAPMPTLNDMPPVPSISLEAKPAANTVATMKVPPGGIVVVALRAGFYQQSRKVEGDKFTVPSMDRVGTWMKCVDPAAEKLHLQMMRKKKNEAGV